MTWCFYVSLYLQSNIVAWLVLGIFLKVDISLW